MFVRLFPVKTLIDNDARHTIPSPRTMKSADYTYSDNVSMEQGAIAYISGQA
jgi:hypothetical protein